MLLKSMVRNSKHLDLLKVIVGNVIEPKVDIYTDTELIDYPSSITTELRLASCYFLEIRDDKYLFQTYTDFRSIIMLDIICTYLMY